jgi:acetyl-CoA carboxylase biotin carboxyl carrier protein
VEEAAQVSAGRSVLKIELVLGDAVAGTDRVDGHADLHSVAAGEGQRRAQDLGPHRALAGDRRLRVEAAEAADSPAGEAERDPEPAADPPPEGGHGKVALTPLDRLDQRRQLRGRGSEVRVAEQDEARLRLVAQRRFGGRGHVPPLAVRAPPAHDPRASDHRQLTGPVRRRIVGNPDRRPREHPPQRSNGLPHPICLVAGGDDDRQRVRWIRGHDGILCPAMAEIEAHITGNVWKITVAVGDEVEDGDTVVILESMKMEIPVEAEDDGTVKEIRCEEGQAVSEGDVLVVLE